MTIEVFDVLALVFGIWLNVRKLDARKLVPEDYPRVDAEGFRRWQDMATRAYSLGSLVCFLKLGLDIALRVGGVRGWFPWTLVRIGGASLFVGWVGTLIYVWVRAFQAGKLRDRLGIGRPVPRVVETDGGETAEDEPSVEPGSDEN